MSNQLITAYRFDEDGYLMGTDQVMEGFLPPDDILLQPETKDGYWPRFVDGAWTYEKMPETAQDFVDLNITVDHQKHTPHVEALREIIRSVATAEREAGKLALNQDPATNNLSVIRVPELTEEEKAQKAAEEAEAEREQKIIDLKNRIFEAFLLGDDDAIAELRAEYRNL